MSTPTVPVTVDLAAMGGPALAGITVRATLDGNEVYTGIVVAKRLEAVTDASGVAILNLFPNAPPPTGLGTQGTTYRFTATVPGGRGLNVDARVPNTACRLENILVLDEIGPLSAAELALLQAQAVVAPAAASAAASAASAAAADADATQTAADRVQTALDRVATAADRVQTAADRVQTGLDRAQTGADRVQTGLDRIAASASASAAASSEAQAAAIVLGNFLQAGTGAVARTFSDKARERITALDYMTTAEKADVTGFVGALDVSAAIQKAKTYADSIGAVLEYPPGFYTYSQTIVQAAGQKARGAGWGNNPLGAGSTNSTILNYTGTAEAVKITGHQAEFIGFALRDTPNTATHGVRVLADSTNLIEGARVDVYVNGFTGTGAWAFSCEATDGAIAYGDFNVRARSCSNYFKIQDNNDGRAPPFGFVNSNSFRLVCSGGETGATAPGYALYVDGGNDNNILPGSVLEPFQTQNNHVKVIRGSLCGKLRVEGSSQPSTRLLVDIAAAAQVSSLEFDPGTAYMLNRSRASTVKNKGAKSAQPTNPNRNLYKNAHWSHNRDGALADWTVTGAGVTWEVLEPDFIPGFRTLKVTVPAGIACTLAQPIPVTNTDFSYVSHGAWIKYDSTTYPGGAANVSTFTTAGTAGGGLHTGDNTYQYLGQAVQWNTGTPTNFQNKVNLTGGSGPTVFYVTCPMLCFGNELPDVAAHQYEGIKRVVVVDLATIHNSGNNEITLPVNADTYLITSTVGAKTITRINNTSTFFPVNKEITLLFNSTSAGSTISTASSVISARANITTDQYSVVRLQHDKAGQWRVTSNY